MSDEVLVVAAKLKEEERLTERIKNELLSRKKIEYLDFDQEVLDGAYGILDQLMMIDSDISVSFYIAQVNNRIRLAEEVMGARDRYEHRLQVMKPETYLPELEGFNE